MPKALKTMGKPDRHRARVLSPRPLHPSRRKGCDQRFVGTGPGLGRGVLEHRAEGAVRTEIVTKTHDVRIGEPGSHLVGDAAIGEIRAWYRSLSTGKQAVSAGGMPRIMLHEFTSTTGTEASNQVLARRRADADQLALAGVAGTGGTIEIFAHGELDSARANNTEPMRERRAKIGVSWPERMSSERRSELERRRSSITRSGTACPLPRQINRARSTRF